MLAVYLSALAVTVAAQRSPGPNLLAVAGVALEQGRVAAIIAALGVATGETIGVVSLALGVAALFDSYPWLINVLQLIGGCYFIHIGIRAMISAINNQPKMIKSHDGMIALSSAFRIGLLVVLTNPKAAIMWISLITFMTTSGLSTSGLLIFAPIGGTSALIIYGGYGLLFSTHVAQAFYKKTARAFEALCAITFSGIGAY